MAQLIYAISALGIVTVISVSMQNSSSVGEQSVYRNEVLTQLVTVGRDIVDEIARQDLPFDEEVNPDSLPTPSYYPYVHYAWQLTPAAEFGGCADFYACQDLDDFHEIDPPIEGERGGIEYTANIEVKYVDLENPSTDAGTQTFAKEVIVTVESESIQINGEPIAATYSRVITYPRITNYSY
jgi:hypothetical protein